MKRPGSADAADRRLGRDAQRVSPFRRRYREPDRVFVQLVEALFTASLPLGIMVATFLLVGGYVTIRSHDGIAGLATAGGAVAAAYKLWLHWSFRRDRRDEPIAASEAGMWERRFAAGNLVFALAIGVVTARSFALPGEGAQLLTTGMLFGFCSGQVARVAVRPRVCSRSILVAACPAAIGSAAHGDIAHLGLAGMFSLFIVGGLESARYAYGQIRERIASNLELERIAGVDPLTGLCNRLGLRRAVDACLRPDLGDTRMIAVHCFDLDGFKAVNDAFGHLAGDELLKELARRVRGLLRGEDMAARLGGDEFLVIQVGVSHPDEAELFARRLCRAVTAPYALGGRTMVVGGSLGSCTGRPSQDLLEDLVATADARMYEAKRAGGGIMGAGQRAHDVLLTS